MTVRDPDFKMVQVRANGTTVVRVTDPTAFLRQVIGTESKVDMEQITELIRRNIALAFNDMVMGSGLGAIDLQGRQVELSDKLREFVAQRVQAFGLGIDAVTMTISLPEEIQQAMTRGVARGLEESGFLNNVGDLDRFTQARRADAMLAAAQNEGGGAAGSAIQAGLGVALGKSDGQRSTGWIRPTTTIRSGTTAGCRGATAVASAATVPFRSAVANRPVRTPSTHCGSSSAAVQLTRDTVVWTEGMPGWAPASTVPALAAVVQRTASAARHPTAASAAMSFEPRIPRQAGVRRIRSHRRCPVRRQAPHRYLGRRALPHPSPVRQQAPRHYPGRKQGPHRYPGQPAGPPPLPRPQQALRPRPGQTPAPPPNNSPFAGQSGGLPGCSTRPSDTRTYPCASCGGQLNFDIASQKLRCPNCGNYYDISAPNTPVRSRELRGAMQQLRGTATTPSRARKSPACGR